MPHYLCKLRCQLLSSLAFWALERPPCSTTSSSKRMDDEWQWWRTSLGRLTSTASSVCGVGAFTQCTVHTTHAPSPNTVAENLIEHEELVSMENGCVCCSLRSDIVTALAELDRRAKKRGQPFDNVLLETTGLADPAPVAFTFFANPWIGAKFRLDSILCLVDALHISKVRVCGCVCMGVCLGKVHMLVVTHVTHTMPSPPTSTTHSTSLWMAKTIRWMRLSTRLPLQTPFSSTR